MYFSISKKKLFSLFFVLSACFHAFSCAHAKPSYLPHRDEIFEGEVVSISDGDTFTVLVNRKPVKVRLYGVDSPEVGQPFGKAAKQFASSQLFGRDVTVKTKDRDQYGRVIGIVTTKNGEDFNELLAQEGYAWWYSHYAPRAERLQDAELSARRSHKGLWSDNSMRPVAPWIWRRNRR